MESPEPRGRRALRLGEGALLVAAALFALAFQLWLPSRLPNADDHEAAARSLASHLAPGDVVLLHPWWTERARLYVPPGVPVVGYLGSDADALVDHPRIWVLSQPGLPRAENAAFERRFLPGRTPLAPPERFGPLVLQPFANGRHRPTRFDAAALLTSARAYLEAPDGRRVDCARAPDGFRCPDRNANRVALEWHEVLYQPRRCLFMPPPGGPRRLVLELPALPAAEQLSLEAGVIWELAWQHRPELTPVEVGLESSGAPVVGLAIAPGTEGMQQRTRSPSPELSAGAKLWTRSENAKDRAVCVELRGLGDEGQR